MAALIEDKILCIHGGIGQTIHTLEDISSIVKPITVSLVPYDEVSQKVSDILWSDPTENDSKLGIVPNQIRDPDQTSKIVRFGPDRVIDFLVNNKLDLIIRAHECVMDGFERFAAGRLITLFSATDYCSTHGNAGALLFIRRNLSILPKIIYPARMTNKTLNNSTWLTLDTSRPPTPPRTGRPIQNWPN